MSPSLRIAPGCRVTLHLSLATTGGTELLSTFGEEPSTILAGGGDLAPGLELALYGLQGGDRQTLQLTPEQAFGEHRAELLREIPLTQFDAPPELGQVLLFTNEAGTELPGTVIGVDETNAQIDLNHPLAGREVIFTVQIIEVVSPAAQE